MLDAACYQVVMMWEEPVWFLKEKTTEGESFGVLRSYEAQPCRGFVDFLLECSVLTRLELKDSLGWWRQILAVEWYRLFFVGWLE